MGASRIWKQGKVLWCWQKKSYSWEKGIWTINLEIGNPAPYPCHYVGDTDAEPAFAPVFRLTRANSLLYALSHWPRFLCWIQVNVTSICYGLIIIPFPWIGKWDFEIVIEKRLKVYYLAQFSRYLDANGRDDSPWSALQNISSMMSSDVMWLFYDVRV